MRVILVIVFCGLCLTGVTQPDEFLVYSVKGNVAVTEGNASTKPLKIGRVLPVSAKLTLEKEARVTLVCNGLRSFILSKPGSVQLSNLHDSCAAPQASVFSRYLDYVWKEMYTRSTDHKERRISAPGSVDRFPPPENKTYIERSTFYDTVNYTSGALALHWYTNYEKPVRFTIYDMATDQKVFEKLVDSNHLAISSFKSVLRKGEDYYWTLSAGKLHSEKKQLLRFRPAGNVAHFIDSIAMMPGIEEEDESRLFRIGYFLEENHYPVEALRYYEMAATIAPSQLIYVDNIKRIRSRMSNAFSAE